MWKGSYGKEPFDLRLTMLRLMGNANRILALTLAGTLLFGGGYYVKNVLFRPAKEYAVTSTYKVQYVDEPTKSGDYFINEATWNTLVDTAEFLNAVQENLAEETASAGVDFPDLTVEELAEAISAKLPSDWHISTTTVVLKDARAAEILAKAVERTMTDAFVEMMKQEVASVVVLDAGGQAEEVLLDVRPLRAFVLSAILSLFFITTVFLLKEMGDDSIWLPSTLRRRYGLPVLGTIHSVEFSENLKYLFGDKGRVAVCAVEDKVNPAEVLMAVREKADEKHRAVMSEWIAVPSPLMCPQICEKLRDMDGVLLVVKAGSHAGKPLEYVMEMLEQQDCKITAVLLWEADERLIKAYYWRCTHES